MIDCEQRELLKLKPRRGLLVRLDNGLSTRCLPGDAVTSRTQQESVHTEAEGIPAKTAFC